MPSPPHLSPLSNMPRADTHAMEAVRAADHDRYLSALYAPDDKRQSLFALYAFNVEIASIRDRIREPLPGEVRLQWWRDVLDGRASGDGHPVGRRRCSTRSAPMHCRLRRSRTISMRAIFDLYDDPMPSRNDLEGYCGEIGLVADPACVDGPRCVGRTRVCRSCGPCRLRAGDHRPVAPAADPPCARPVLRARRHSCRGRHFAAGIFEFK